MFTFMFMFMFIPIPIPPCPLPPGNTPFNGELFPSVLPPTDEVDEGPRNAVALIPDLDPLLLGTFPFPVATEIWGFTNPADDRLFVLV